MAPSTNTGDPIERVAAELAHLKQTRPDDFQRAVELLDPIMRG